MLSDRIDKGMALLDRKNTDWIWRINLDDLDQGCSAYCVLGQLYDDFYDGVGELNIYSYGRPYRAAYEHGFCTWLGMIIGNPPKWVRCMIDWMHLILYKRHTKMWKRKILAQRFTEQWAHNLVLSLEAKKQEELVY